MASLYNWEILVNYLLCVSILIFIGGNSVSCEVALPCSLKWKTVLRKEALPVDSVATHGDEHFVARLGSSFSGRVVNSTGIAFLLYNQNNAARTTIYEVLTNPNDCALTWERTEAGGDMPEKRFAVPYGGSGEYVARVKYEKEELAAILKEEFYYVATPSGGMHKNIAGAAKYLKSTINLRCELSNFDFNGQDVEDGEPDFLGMDTIINDADTIVTQTVVHSKTFTESYTFTESTSFSQVTTWSVSLKIPAIGLGVEFNHEKREANSETTSIGHTKEEEVTSTRTVVVPPNTAVEICSIVYVPDGFQMGYTAIGRYYIKGKTAQEVKNILDAQPIDDIEIIELREDSVYAKLNGTLEISVPTKTRFIITPKGDANGCKEIHGKIQQLKVGKKIKKWTKDMTNSLHTEIKQMIDANIQPVSVK